MKQKIAILTNSLSLGGAERVSVLLAEWLHSQAIEVAIVTLNKDREEGYNLNSGVTRIAINPDSTSSNFTIIKDLRKSLKEYRPSLVLVMGVPLCVRVVPSLFGLNIPVIISERNDPTRFAGKKITKFLSRFFMKFANGYVFQTKDAMNFYSKKIQGKSTVIPNPLTAENMPSPFKGERQKKIVTAGRLVKQKNHSLLINAFYDLLKIYPDYSLHIYGNGSDHDKLELLIKELDLDGKVFLPGASKDIFNEINDAEVFVLSSDYEGMPNALIEAMALGLPVISTDCPCGGPKSLIENMFNGLLIPVADKEKLVASLVMLISNKNISTQIGNNAIYIRNELDKEKICNLWLEYFNKVK